MKIKRTRAITLICDASHCPRTNAYGWAFYATHTNHHIHIYRSGGGDFCPTSTQAESLAINQGIQLLLDQALVYNRHVIIVSDCRVALHQVNRKRLKAHGARRVSLRHIEGHQHNKFTEAHFQHKWCDRIARKIMTKYRQAYIQRIQALTASGN